MNELIYHKNIKINLPEPVSLILKTLREAGFEAYAVGGCVRDSILGLVPKDWDITTSAKPLETKALFRRTIDTGIQHGTVTVMIKGEGYEVTTYRVDGEYYDGRHPKEVTFTASLIEDLKRRDFTINAMAYNEEHGVVDCFGGIGDLGAGIIRCVGEAKERFSEDALRMLRAVRFGSVLGFDICEGTLTAIKDLAPNIEKISRERIQAELRKLIMSPHPDRVMILYETGLMKYIFKPDKKENAEIDLKENAKFNSRESSETNIRESTETESSESVEAYGRKYCRNDNGGKLLAKRLSASPQNHYVRWAIFITFVNSDNILRSLKFDNATIKICGQLFKYRDEKLSADEADLRHSIVKIGKDIFGEYYLPYRMILAEENEKETELLKLIYDVYMTIINRGDCLSIGELAVSGNDIRELGVSEGKEVGRLLNGLFEAVLNDNNKNNKDYLLRYAKQLIDI